MGTFIKSDFRSTDTTAPRVLSAYASDGFNRPDATTLGKTETGAYPWVISYGGGNVGSIVSKTAQISNTAGAGTARIDDGRADGVLSAQLVDFTKFTGLVFRGSTVNAAEYMFYADAGLYRMVDKTGPDTYGKQFTLSASAPTPALNDVLSVILKGASITLQVNGITVASITDSTYSGTTKGMVARATTSRFDKFRWDPLP